MIAGKLVAGTALLLGALTVEVSGVKASFTNGAVEAKGPDQLALWCNSPQATLTLDNSLHGGFAGVGTTWQNLVNGAYVATPEGVVIGTSRDGSALKTQLTMQPREKQRWALKPNMAGSYRFAVIGETRNPVSGSQTFGKLSKDMGRRQVQFAVHLGNAAAKGNASQLQVFREQLRSFPFPTYCLPGNEDVAGEGKKAWRQLFGEVPEVFAIGRDRFVLLDNANGKLDKAEVSWLDATLKRANDEHARHIFVFMHQPLVDIRPGLNQGMQDLTQVRALLQLFQARRVHTVFAGHIPMYARETRRGVYYVTSGGGGQKLAPLAGAGAINHYVRVEVNGDDVRAEAIKL
jgi:hypothetical protein